MFVKRILILLIFLSTYYLCYCQEFWESIYSCEEMIFCITIDSEDNIFIGCPDVDYFDGAVRYSDDNGETWQLIESGIITPDIGIEYLSISDDNHLYAISYENINHVYRSVQEITSNNGSNISCMKNVKLNNYPNPFNPSTEIRFQTSDIGEIENAKIEIYNLRGQKIKTFPINSSTDQPINSVVWNGTDQNNQTVSSGIYLYKLNIPNSPVKKMILLK